MGNETLPPGINLPMKSEISPMTASTKRMEFLSPTNDPCMDWNRTKISLWPTPSRTFSRLLKRKRKTLTGLRRRTLVVFLTTLIASKKTFKLSTKWSKTSTCKTQMKSISVVIEKMFEWRRSSRDQRRAEAKVGLNKQRLSEDNSREIGGYDRFEAPQGELLEGVSLDWSRHQETQ